LIGESRGTNVAANTRQEALMRHQRWLEAKTDKNKNPVWKNP
jgi:hypothetical protein